ncbi:MAG: cyclic nucleotide-binding domain-containing protein [Prevotella sp.]|nr:cyclic nucleotide-binding domain-containing protein [Bacteroides sp.]MCM1366919.1 cyclic nucleotide-binding domain-containing protein [Prevotella sp.]
MDTEISMYELIMDLPLFKGTSRDQISDFLERTTLTFSRYEDGEKIVSIGEKYDDLFLIIRGNSLVNHPVSYKDETKVLLCETRGAGTIIGLDRLYGMFREYEFEVVSKNGCDILRLNKSQFFDLLTRDNLYMINMLNALSSNSQRSQWLTSLVHPCDIISLMAYYVATLTRWNSKDICINPDVKLWQYLAGVSVRGFNAMVKNLGNGGLIRIDSENNGWIKILNRSDFIDFVFSRK